MLKIILKKDKIIGAFVFVRVTKIIIKKEKIEKNMNTNFNVFSIILIKK